MTITLDRGIPRQLKGAINLLPVLILFIVGLWLVVLRPLGTHMHLVPGDLGDSRFNNYILEHFFRWVTGATKDYWNAPFFFPFPLTITFSDNLLGSAPIYALIRWSGFDTVSAFQGWYILGYLLNFAAASFILWRIKFHPLAIGTGAFFFTFGLPLLAQENHVQLLYRFCIPLACYSLWQFYQSPRLRTLVILGLWLVWQFYLSIYIGIFLALLLLTLFILIPVFAGNLTFFKRLALWPQRLVESWSRSNTLGRISTLCAIAALMVCLLALLLPYYHASRVYGFFRSWNEVSTMLPRIQSYLIADNAQFWSRISHFIPTTTLRWEHQLFPGMAVVILLLVGIIGRFKTENSTLAWIHFTAALILVVLTLDIHGYSIYKFLWHFPGMNSIRAITRIMLVIMWPLALFITWAVDGFMLRFSQSRWMQVMMYLVAGLMVAESVFYAHSTYDKAEAQQRLDTLRQQIPQVVPANPVLYIAGNPQDPRYATEIDAMLLSQELGWSTVNGYSGNSPPSYMPANTCQQLPMWIKDYMDFAGISDPSFYFESMKRLVPIGFQDCDPTWWEVMP